VVASHWARASSTARAELRPTAGRQVKGQATPHIRKRALRFLSPAVRSRKETRGAGDPGAQGQGCNRTTEFVIDGLRLYNKVNAGPRAHEQIAIHRIGNGTCVAVHVALNFVTQAGCPGRLSGECLCDALLATR
jgi:hypothetical protein